MVYLTAELGTEGDEEFDALIKTNIAGGGLIPHFHKQLIVKDNGSKEVWEIKNIFFLTESSQRTVAHDAKPIDLSWRAGPGNNVNMDTQQDLLDTHECGESGPSSIYTYRCLIHNWPDICSLTMSGEDNVDKVSKGDYIDTWTMSSGYEKKNVGSILAKKATEAVVEDDGDEVVLEEVHCD